MGFNFNLYYYDIFKIKNILIINVQDRLETYKSKAH